MSTINNDMSARVADFRSLKKVSTDYGQLQAADVVVEAATEKFELTVDGWLGVHVA
ncbi:hypothetical protein [Caballeronia udeis]|uniref:hypothetical protein n=1 Tax=Caballeronia udeis TaxID=1232866 RepID=UPI000AF1685E|nr:hypothetical protein [Caballeronia udeis]